MLSIDLKEKIVPPEALHRLYLTLISARKIYSEEVPMNIVTMNSTFIIRSVQTGVSIERTLIYPARENDLELRQCISIYDVLGLSVFGYRENDIIGLYENEGGNDPGERYIIDKVLFQPESMQLYNL